MNFSFFVAHKLQRDFPGNLSHIDFLSSTVHESNFLVLHRNNIFVFKTYVFIHSTVYPWQYCI